MPHDKHHILWPDGDHPSLELLRQYQQGDLPSALHHQLERHLLDCALCADVLEGMELSDAMKTKAAVADINERVHTQTEQHKKKAAPMYWQSAAAILILVASAMLVLYYNYNLQQPALKMAHEEAVVKPAEAPLLDLSPPSAATAPDSLSLTKIPAASVAAVTPGRKYTSPVVKQDTEEVFDQEVLEEVYYDDVNQEDVLVDDKPIDTGYLAGIDATVEKQPLTLDSTASFLQKKQKPTMALAPESTAVSRALAGKAAGVTIKGVGTIKPKTSSNQKQITGQVLSPEGQPLTGVAVLLKGSTTGVTTDAAGNYTLAVPEGEQTLRFSFIGFETAEKTLARNDTSADITLSTDQRALSEVVVTGYGIQREVPEKVAPMPASGMRKYKVYLQQNSRTVPMSGKVKVAFIVATNGKPQQIRVVKSLCPACDAEAIRLVQEGPLWKPGLENGQPVEREVRISIKFKE